MNKIYSIKWSDIRQVWVVVSEATAHHGKPAKARRLASALLTGLLATSVQAAPPVAPPVNTLPTGGQVVAGQANINQAGNVLNVQQSTDKAAINWNSFSIGAAATVNFIQPNSSSVTLNRVLGSDPSYIFGHLNANGQVFLLNPNGVLFGNGAKVDVGGLVATTLRLNDTDFLSGNYHFTGNGAGSVVNQGELIGKYIALLAPEVRNEGVIIARQGTVALAASDSITLNLVNNQLIDVMVDKANIDTLVENKQLIQADEGTVILSAQSANNLLGKVVNTGTIEAKGITNDGGKVRLTASSEINHSGSINVDAGSNGKGGSATIIADLSNKASLTTISGSISAKGGSASGDGGFIETSASNLKIADTARINTTAAYGVRGNWLLDPNDFTVAAAGGDITGAALSSALNTSNVTIQTTVGAANCTGATCGAGTAGNGDIIFNDAVYWTNGLSTLTLDAYRNIVFNKSVIQDVGMFGPPGPPAVQMTYGTGGTGAAYTTTTADWVTPFSSFIAAGNMQINDVTYGGSLLTPALLVVNNQDFYFGAKGINIYTQAATGSSTYDGNAVLFAPLFSLDAAGTQQININPVLVAGTPTWNIAAPTNAGTYSGILNTGGLSSTAYAGLTAGAAATWTITPRPITLAATNQNKTYGSTLALGNTAFTLASGTMALSEAVTNATLTSANGYAAAAAQNAGTYSNEITIGAATGGGGFNAANYNITYTAGNLTIDKATLTYNANTAGITAGDAIPALSGTVTGFVLGQNITATTGTLAFATPATTLSPAGGYAINGGGLAATNYNFVQAAGNATALTVSAAATGAGTTTTTPQVDIIKRTIQQRSRRSGADADFWDKVANTTKGATQDVIATVTQAVKDNCKGTCNITEQDVTHYLGGKLPTPTLTTTTVASLPDGPNKTNIINLYKAFFGRLPDLAGFTNFDNELTALTQGGMSTIDAVTMVANNFVTSKEFTDQLKGSTEAEFVNTIFINLYGRSPTVSSLTFWEGALASGRLSLASFVANLIISNPPPAAAATPAPGAASPTTTQPNDVWIQQPTQKRYKPPTQVIADKAAADAAAKKKADDDAAKQAAAAQALDTKALLNSVFTDFNNTKITLLAKSATARTARTAADNAYDNDASADNAAASNAATGAAAVARTNADAATQLADFVGRIYNKTIDPSMVDFTSITNTMNASLKAQGNSQTLTEQQVKDYMGFTIDVEQAIADKAIADKAAAAAAQKALDDAAAAQKVIDDAAAAQNATAPTPADTGTPPAASQKIYCNTPGADCNVR